jgi:hypothetical protein
MELTGLRMVPSERNNRSAMSLLLRPAEELQDFAFARRQVRRTVVPSTLAVAADLREELATLGSMNALRWL